jgi:hypothetical protein
MYTDIKTFEDACNVLNLDASKVIPDFSLFPKEEQKPMIAHAKLIIIAKAINGDWVPDWQNGKWDKYYPWFKMGSSSGVGFAYNDYDRWDSLSSVGSRLCFESAEKAKYAGTQFLELYKEYFVKE